MNAGWRLINSKTMAFSSPNTWTHPPKQYFFKLSEGCLVKVGVIPSTPIPGSERFWCRIKAISKTKLTVTVEQADMLFSTFHGIYHGDTLTILKNNVFGMLDENGNLIWEA
jgi:hypothetical protein